ncbi:glutamyl-tRNA reductase [Fulvivirga kasyanovii]|uniref:Glutamyl-tRNA reductase n=1 Tax=Fulvivirga kasyanovii TaxID=396812 RepID=A0ABW9RN92_9BACT|nr:glutamyl-tRNA reductase [Fulvivirga kasyanovii]MTI25257.1 glutamyl-tRNA reductase [Fulvivirga kasyanovii]
MSHVLRYIGISHQTASVSARESFCISETLRRSLSKSIAAAFSDVHGLVLISTCNRTEIYFESQSTKAAEVRDFFVRSVGVCNEDESRGFFELSDNTSDTADRLMQVANGLQSAVVGDKQIISQVKEAYQFCLAQKQQGSLLERLFQAVFKSHKRIANESHYRSGSTSTAYCSLRLIEKALGKAALPGKNLLIIGAGEIARDVVSYLGKFDFGRVYIANRTSDKAADLAQKHGLVPYDWELVEAGQFEHFDAIITAVSNRQYLLQKPAVTQARQVIVDLGFPMNVHPTVGAAAKLYNIDDVSGQITRTDQLQAGALAKVKVIIKEELDLFMDWVEKGDKRKIIRKFKAEVEITVAESLKQHNNTSFSRDRQQAIIQTLSRKMTNKQAAFLMGQA